MDSFNAEFRHIDGAVVIHLFGELDLWSAPRLGATLRAISYRYERGQVTFDCGDLKFVDSAGLLAIVRGVQAMDPVGTPTLARPNPLLLRLLQILSLDALFTCPDAASRQQQSVATASGM